MTIVLLLPSCGTILIVSIPLHYLLSHFTKRYHKENFEKIKHQIHDVIESENKKLSDSTLEFLVSYSSEWVKSGAGRKARSVEHLVVDLKLVSHSDNTHPKVSQAHYHHSNEDDALNNC